MILGLRSVSEPHPGPKWQQLFEKSWPFYRNWYLAEGFKARPGYLTASSELRKHMPEIAPIYDKLVELAGGGDVEARFLSLYCPPPYVSGCSQIAWTKDRYSIIRNYDYSPKLFDGLLLHTEWLQPVIGISDCMWGLLDGMNASGLAVSLTFGGSKRVGVGFGIPLVIRYVLETCHTTKKAVQVLSRVPVHMAYNLTIVDKMGAHSTVLLAPGREPIVTQDGACTNHQNTMEWTEYAVMTQTRERKVFLEEALHDPEETRESMLKKFFLPPLFHTKYEKAFGTLYTALYDVLKGEIQVYWRDRMLTQSFDKFVEGNLLINLAKVIPGKVM
jgi:predicted choloylglycine hydrolase